jgi:gliding motility-associated-like protein
MMEPGAAFHLRSLSSLVPALAAFAAWAQCGTVIGTFPYTEDFETAAGWTSGGTGNDWTWGTPAHPLINSAGSGTKCWCVGGLSGTFYANDESSYLESPCFDFTGLDNPRISFMLFWEVERQNDGMTFQYSTDGGTTYSNVGGFGEPQDCITSYWFNTSSITYLPATISPKEGWSGREGSTQGSCLGGNGSQAWVTARHCLGWLANQPSVRFRFYFGAGNQCNNYDGIAIDDVVIDEAEPVVAAFSAVCDGTTFDFSNTSGPCPSSYAWDFGDPGSAQNTSVQENPSHTYSGPGAYTVTLTATDACGASGTTSQQVSVLALSLVGTQPHCGMDNGAVQATVTGNTMVPSYSWSPSGDTNALLDSLAPGTYTCIATAPNSCPATASITLDPAMSTLAVDIAHTDVTCTGVADGTATAQPTGGVGLFTLDWQPGGSTALTITDLPPGDYSCTVTDSQGCTDQESVTIGEPDPLQLDPLAPVPLCQGSTVTLTANATGGTPGYTYAWSPDGPDVSPAVTTTYTVVATDANGCTSPPVTTTVTVSVVFVPSFTSTDSAGCAPYCITFSAPPTDAAQYQWDFGDGGSGTGDTAEHCYQQGGAFTVALSLIDAEGCVGTLTVPDYAIIQPSPIASFTPTATTVIVGAPPIRFLNSTVGGDSSFWTFGDPGNSSSEETSPSFSPPGVGCYTVTLVASTVADCRDTISTIVCMEDPYALYMPNAFSPNDDEINELLRPITTVQDPRDFRMSIYDRWGSLIYTTRKLEEGWDGAKTDPGVYVWKIWISDAQGNMHEHIGHVTLLR